MKRLFTVLVVLVLVIVGCEKLPDNEFLGLRFGASVGETQSAMQDKATSYYDAKLIEKKSVLSGHKVLTYEGNHIFSEAIFTMCFFTGGELTKIKVVFNPYSEDKDKIFNRLKEFIEDKYGRMKFTDPVIKNECELDHGGLSITLKHDSRIGWGTKRGIILTAFNLGIFLDAMEK